MAGTRIITSIDRLLALAHRGPEAGTALDEARERLAELHAALAAHQMDYGGEPTATLKLAVKFKRTRRGGVTFEVMQDVSPPKPPAAGGAAFVNDDGQLTLDDPALRDVEIRDVAPAAEIRSAPPKEA